MFLNIHMCEIKYAPNQFTPPLFLPGYLSQCRAASTATLLTFYWLGRHEALHWDTRKGFYFTVWRSSCSLSKYGNLNHCSLWTTLRFVTQERTNKLHLLCKPGSGTTAFAGMRMHLLFTLCIKNATCETYASDDSTLFTILWKLPCFINVKFSFFSLEDAVGLWIICLWGRKPVRNQWLLLHPSHKCYDVTPVSQDE